MQVPVRGTSLTQQVLDILSRGIREGDYYPGSQLPPENQLSAQFNVSRATVRSAIEMLAERGLVVRRRGIGTFVSRLSAIANPLNEAMDFHTLIASNGFEPGHRFVYSAVVVPPADVLKSLGLQPGDRVLKSHKVFTADDEPVIYAINHIPTWLLGDELLARTLADPTMTEPLFAFLEDRCGQKIEYHIARLHAELTTECPFPELSTGAASPLLVMEEIGYNSEEQPVWHSTEYYPSRHMSFEVVRHRRA